MKNRPWIRWMIMLAAGAGLSYAGLTFYEPPLPEVPTAVVERRDFLTTVSSRGELKSGQSTQIVAPQTPDLTIVTLADNGKPIQRGQLVVRFDAAAQEDLFVERDTTVRQVQSEIEQAEAAHSIADEENELTVMQSEFEVERAQLEVSKQEILAEIDALKAEIDVDIADGVLQQAKTTSEATDISQNADLSRLKERLQKAVRDRDLSKSYLGNMELYSPVDGIVHIMTNNRAQGSFGTSRPPFQEGDDVWTGAVIAEIPDLSTLRAEFTVDEINRGRTHAGQELRIKVDAVPDARLEGEIEWVSPIAELVFSRIPPEKSFPAHGSIRRIDPRLRPGMSCTVETIVERRPNVLVIPAKASFQIDGVPSVYVKEGLGFRVRPIEVVARNTQEIVVSSGIEEGDEIALVNPETILGKR